MQMLTTTENAACLKNKVCCDMVFSVCHSVMSKWRIVTQFSSKQAMLTVCVCCLVRRKHGEESCCVWGAHLVIDVLPHIWQCGFSVFCLICKELDSEVRTKMF